MSSAVNSAIYSPSGGSVGIGFSIPSNLVRDVIAQLRAHGTLQRGWIGVRIQAVTNDLAEGLGAPSAMGALITDVTPKGPAAKAGIANGDLVTAFDGKVITDSRVPAAHCGRYADRKDRAGRRLAQRQEADRTSDSVETGRGKASARIWATKGAAVCTEGAVTAFRSGDWRLHRSTTMRAPSSDFPAASKVSW
ncbi:MAG: PDZ domain-containing protein [Rhizomicrobium sp.]